MKAVKKSFNISGDLAQMIDNYIRENPGISFTWLMNQAVLSWLKNPEVTLNHPKPMSEDEINKYMQDNAELMSDLAK